MAGEGKQFEASIEQCCKEQGIWYFRVRDVNPMALKPKYKVPQNKYDCLLYHKYHLFPIEMKSTKEMNISLKEHMIKKHQIDNLVEAAKYEGVISGFLFNFREPEQKTFFVKIEDFVKYKNIAENGLEHTYKSKVNRASIPIGICEEIGIEVKSAKKVKNYRYYIGMLIDELIAKS